MIVLHFVQAVNAILLLQFRKYMQHGLLPYKLQMMPYFQLRTETNCLAALLGLPLYFMDPRLIRVLRYILGIINDDNNKRSILYIKLVISK